MTTKRCVSCLKLDRQTHLITKINFSKVVTEKNQSQSKVKIKKNLFYQTGAETQFLVEECLRPFLSYKLFKCFRDKVA